MYIIIWIIMFIEPVISDLLNLFVCLGKNIIYIIIIKS